MIQDIYPYHYDVAYTPSSPSGPDFVYIFPEENRVLLKSDGTTFRYEEVREFFPQECFRYLFRISERSFFWMDSETRDPGSSSAADYRSLPGNPVLVPLGNLRQEHTVLTAFEGYTAAHLISWYRSSRFCGRCGTRMIDGSDERKLVCPHCGNILYPRINPSVIVAVYDGDRLLMTRYAGRKVSWYVLVAGFIEIGESAEDTVKREVMEETGVHVKNIRYFGSQPWGIPGNLTLGYTAQLDGSDALTIQKDELSDGKWFHREDVPVRENDDLSITTAMVRAFKEGKF